MNPLSEHTESSAAKVLSRIEKEGICPRPRWHFLLREGCVWTLGVASVIFGAGAVAGTLFEIQNSWWDFYEATHETFWTFTLDALPFVWVVGFGFFALTAYASMRYTKRGYRYKLHTLLLGSLVLSGIGGTVLYGIGIGRFIDEDVGAFVPMHHSLFERERNRWMHPEEGRIAGVVREIPYAEGTLWLQGVDDVIYHINLTDFVPRERELVRVGDQIRILGVPTTTAGVLDGCVILMQHGDVLGKFYHLPGVPALIPPKAEKNIFFARSNECKGMRPFTRLAPLQQ